MVTQAKKQCILPVLFLATAVLSSCALLPVQSGPKINAGDKVAIRYTCRLPDGRIVSSTEEDVTTALSDTDKKIFFFRPDKDQHQPRVLEAGKTPGRESLSDVAPGMEDLPSLQLLSLHETLDQKLADAVVGKTAGRWFKTKISATAQTDVPEPERQIFLTRAMKAPKTMRVAIEQFENRTGAATPPAVGVRVGMYPGIVGEVTEMTDTEAIIHFSPASWGLKETAFGPRKVEDKGDHYLIFTDVEKNSLVKTGPHLGQVADVKGGQFLLDYAHPFGGRELSCRVMAEPLVEPMEKPVTTRDTTAGLAEVPADTMATVVGGAVTADAAGSAAEAPIGQSAGEAMGSVVEAGDLVEIHYTARLNDGRLIYTTREEVATAPDVEKTPWYSEPPNGFAPELVTAGEDAPPPGLGRAVLGLSTGETQDVKLAPADAFGLPNPGNVKQYDRIRALPRETTMTFQEWSTKFDSFPAVEKEYEAGPYLTAKVIEVIDDRVNLVYIPKADSFDRPLGKVLVRTTEESVELELAPEVGANYTVAAKDGGTVSGTIVSVQEDTFTVDFNHPLAGKEICLDVDIIKLVKTAGLADVELDWAEDYDAGLALSYEKNKPAVVVLYAGWCGYSKRFLNESLQSSIIKTLKDDFVWVKVDSDQNSELKDLYSQTSFPLTVVVGPKGDILGRINGYKDAPALYQILRQAIEKESV